MSVVVSENDFYDENILVPDDTCFEMLNDALTLSLSFGTTRLMNGPCNRSFRFFRATSCGATA